ncbi:MAG: hypothetical protein JNM84_20610 [Planctomycetes bacterium]|nr:hypothetical protein [Planctomycetota bacterium]
MVPTLEGPPEAEPLEKLPPRPLLPLREGTAELEPSPDEVRPGEEPTLEPLLPLRGESVEPEPPTLPRLGAAGAVYVLREERPEPPENPEPEGAGAGRGVEGAGEKLEPRDGLGADRNPEP